MTTTSHLPPLEKALLLLLVLVWDLSMAYLAYVRGRARGEDTTTTSSRGWWETRSERVREKLKRFVMGSHAVGRDNSDRAWFAGRGGMISRWIYLFMLLVVTAAIASEGQLARFHYIPALSTFTLMIPDLINVLGVERVRASIETTNARGTWMFRLGCLLLQSAGVVLGEMGELQYQYRALTNRVLGSLLFLEDFDDVVLSTLPLYAVSAYISPFHAVRLARRLFNLYMVALFTTTFRLRDVLSDLTDSGHMSNIVFPVFRTTSTTTTTMTTTRSQRTTADGKVRTSRKSRSGSLEKPSSWPSSTYGGAPGFSESIEKQLRRAASFQDFASATAAIPPPDPTALSLSSSAVASEAVPAARSPLPGKKARPVSLILPNNRGFRTTSSYAVLVVWLLFASGLTTLAESSLTAAPLVVAAGGDKYVLGPRMTPPVAQLDLSNPSAAAPRLTLERYAWRAVGVMCFLVAVVVKRARVTDFVFVMTRFMREEEANSTHASFLILLVVSLASLADLTFRFGKLNFVLSLCLLLNLLQCATCLVFLLSPNAGFPGANAINLGLPTKSSNSASSSAKRRVRILRFLRYSIFVQRIYIYFVGNETGDPSVLVTQTLFACVMLFENRPLSDMLVEILLCLGIVSQFIKGQSRDGGGRFTDSAVFSLITFFASAFVQLGRQVAKYQNFELMKLHKDATVFLDHSVKQKFAGIYAAVETCLPQIPRSETEIRNVVRAVYVESRFGHDLTHILNLRSRGRGFRLNREFREVRREIKEEWTPRATIFGVRVVADLGARVRVYEAAGDKEAKPAAREEDAWPWLCTDWELLYLLSFALIGRWGTEEHVEPPILSLRLTPSVSEMEMEKIEKALTAMNNNNVGSLEKNNGSKIVSTYLRQWDSNSDGGAGWAGSISSSETTTKSPEDYDNTLIFPARLCVEFKEPSGNSWRRTRIPRTRGLVSWFVEVLGGTFESDGGISIPVMVDPTRRSTMKAGGTPPSTHRPLEKRLGSEIRRAIERKFDGNERTEKVDDDDEEVEEGKGLGSMLGGGGRGTFLVRCDGHHSSELTMMMTVLNTPTRDLRAKSPPLIMLPFTRFSSLNSGNKVSSPEELKEDDAADSQVLKGLSVGILDDTSLVRKTTSSLCSRFGASAVFAMGEKYVDARFGFIDEVMSRNANVLIIDYFLDYTADDAESPEMRPLRFAFRSSSSSHGANASANAVTSMFETHSREEEKSDSDSSSTTSSTRRSSNLNAFVSKSRGLLGTEVARRLREKGYQGCLLIHTSNDMVEDELDPNIVDGFLSKSFSRLGFKNQISRAVEACETRRGPLRRVASTCD